MDKKNLTPSDAASDVLQERHYSLVTALCMIVGICIGSGIFFKADNILVATGGSIGLGVAMFCIASVVIVFGGLSLSEYAERSDGTGGVLAYAGEYLPASLGRVFGWNFTIIYLPIICAMLSWVVGVYACMAFGIPGGLTSELAIGVVFLVACFGWNAVWPRLSGKLQNATTFVKVIPLVAVGVIGVLFAGQGAMAGADAPGSVASGVSPVQGLSWLAAAAPIAFSFDGWSSATSIAGELRDSRRNLPIALTVAPLLVLALYLAYFVGISTYLGPDTVMDAGDGSLALVFVRLLGPRASVLPNLIALVSVAGSANGIVLAAMRMPYALAQRGDFPFAERVASTTRRGGLPLASALVCLGLSFLWMAVHAFAMTHDLLPNGDVCEVAVSFNMLLQSVVIARVVGFWRRGEARPLRGLVAPVLATAGSLFVGLSALMSPTRWPFVAAFVAILAAMSVWRRARGE